MSNDDLKDKIQMCMSLIIEELAGFNLLLGFDKSDDKLVIMDTNSRKYSKIDLGEFNNNILNIIKENNF